MSYIQPNTNIKILSDVPLDTSYKNTIYFTSASAQTTYFTSKVKYSLTSQSYQRHSSDKMRININAENLFDCNYIMFQNASFGNRWFYAFLTNAEYVNNETSEITYVIDVMQTWFFDYTPKESFVEREHSTTDTAYTNFKPEPIGTEELICYGTETINMNEFYIAVMLAPQSAAESTSWTYDGVISAIQILTGPATSDTLHDMINPYILAGEEDRIIAIYEYPKWIYSTNGSLSEVAEKTHTIVTPTALPDGYNPINNKLLSYPYNMIVISNNLGQTIELKYEQFTSPLTGCVLNVVGCAYPTPNVFVYPKNYRRITDDYDSGLTYSSFPQVVWVGDNWSEYWNTNKTALATSVLATVLSASATVSTGGAAGATLASDGSSLLSTITETLSAYGRCNATPSQIHGQCNCDGLNIGMERCEFTIYKMGVNPYIAKSIDDYFSMFGYNCSELKVPNRNSRPHWNYVKTRGFNAVGSVPAPDMNKIISIYDNGVTFWNNGDEVGDYSLDNSPS